MAMTRALAKRMTALMAPMKQSKKKLKYKNMLKARKFLMAKILELLLRKTNCVKMSFTINLITMTTKTGIKRTMRLSQKLDAKKSRMSKMTPPIASMNMYIIK